MGPERDDFHKTEAVPDKLELIEKQLPYVGLVTISKLLRKRKVSANYLQFQKKPDIQTI